MSSSSTGRSNASRKVLPLEKHPGAKQEHSLLDDRSTADVDENYSENERALEEFIRLHPMLSLDATSEKTLGCIAKMMKTTDLPIPEPEVVSMAHDNMFLCQPDEALGERECAIGEKCITRWLGIFRFGEESTKCFVAKEWLLPSELAVFQEEGKLPAQPKKCLLCTRYFASFSYHLARTQPCFKATSPIALQLFANQVHECVVADETLSIANESGNPEGYRPDVLLYVDEAFANTKSARDGLSQLIFNPIVRFKCSDYSFFLNERTGKWELSQRRLGVSSFGQPASSTDVWMQARETRPQSERQ